MKKPSIAIPFLKKLQKKSILFSQNAEQELVGVVVAVMVQAPREKQDMFGNIFY